ncbi:MAG: RNA-binding transcriptional accessory protein [Myxococcales bacterium]|nr:RNA-binding transcriptional accessory protein [Myxococcales bacterium]
MTDAATPSFDPVPALAEELSLPRPGVAAVVRLLAEGATVPFIARYRKEQTGGLDEVQIRAIEERRTYLLELVDRRAAILASISEQGKLTDDLKARILACTTKAALEDLYLPFKPKRRTRAMIARERGLQPLADRILAQPADGDPTAEAAAFVSAAREVPGVAEALAGARDIVAERIAEDADVRAAVRALYLAEGTVQSTVLAEKANEPTKFDRYYAFEEPLATIPSHRFLAVRRGEQEGVLRLKLAVPLESVTPRVEARVRVDPGSPFAGELAAACRDACTRLLLPSLELDLRVELKQRADQEAVEVFAQNLRQLLLAAPLGGKPVVGVDPGLRTGCKCVAVDATGRYLEAVTIYPSSGDAAAARARHELQAFLQRHKPSAVAVGNGTGGREAEALCREVVGQAKLDAVVVAVSEAGASVYSASEVAREEFPDLDLTLRGAISIARRLQDPLAELVKIDPKAIGVGQYQHDVFQPLLARKLDQVVESCVNFVGVDLNTASAPLLSRVAGLRPGVATNIVAHRSLHGPFKSRARLLDVAGLGPRTFEQAAGFLRIRGGEHPLDASAVHPERYPVVERIAADLGVGLRELVGSAALAARVVVAKYVGEELGEPTLRDILDELQKPGRDPRDRFDPPKFRADVNTLADLKPGLELEGVVTNVTAFGAFVDVGVHQDGLVHISQLSERFVKDPHAVVKPGDRLKVRVLEVDEQRKRISLTARLGEPVDRKPDPRAPRDADRRKQDARAPQNRSGGNDRPARGHREEFSNNPFARLRRP